MKTKLRSWKKIPKSPRLGLSIIFLLQSAVNKNFHLVCLISVLTWIIVHKVPHKNKTEKAFILKCCTINDKITIWRLKINWIITVHTIYTVAFMKQIRRNLILSKVLRLSGLLNIICHGPQTPIWKIGPIWKTKYASAVLRNLGVGVNFRPCSESYFLSGRP